MPALHDVLFPHRLNETGSYDSICKICLSTVASSKVETDLARYERDHACDPVRIYQLREDAFAYRRFADDSKHTEAPGAEASVQPGVQLTLK